MATSVSTCEHCSRLYSDPRMLPCLHSFCLPCLVVITETEENRNSFKCPTCKEDIFIPDENGVNSFPKDLHRAHEAEMVRCQAKVNAGRENCDHCVRSDNTSVSFCINCCEFLCKYCDDNHRLTRKTLKHEIVATGEVINKGEGSMLKSLPQPEMHCPDHDDEVLKFYCRDCEKLICRDCMIVHNSSHHQQCDRLEKVVDGEMQSLWTGLDSSLHAIDALDHAITDCNDMIARVEKKKEEVDSAVVSSIEQVCRTILIQCEEIRLKKITGLEMQRDELQSLRDGLALVSGIITEAKTHSPAQQLSTKRLVKKRAARLLQQFAAASLNPQESDNILTNISEASTINMMVSLGQVVGGAHALSSTCDIGSTLRSIVGKESTITVSAKDEEGKLFPFGGENVEAKIQVVDSEEPPLVVIATDNKDGKYSLSITVSSVGQHLLEISIAGYPIMGSPFSFITRQPRDFALLTCEGTISTYQNPWDVAVTGDGQLAVAEYGQHCVSFYSTDGERQFSFGKSGNRFSQQTRRLYCPTGLAIRNDVMYVSEHDNCVVKFSISQRSCISPSEPSKQEKWQFSSPRGICIDSNDVVYVADHGNNRIQVFDSDGTFSHSITADSSNRESYFIKPWGLAFDPQGLLHISAYGSHCIKVFTPEGRYVKSYGTGTLQYPAGIAINDEGYVAITDHRSNCVVIYDPNHTHLVNTIQGFSNPIGIIFDANAILWVTDQSRNCVWKY